MRTAELSLPTPMAVGRRIMLAREARGLTQEQLAQHLGIASHQSISELEKGNRSLAVGELARLAEVLDRPVDYFADPFEITGEAQYSWRRSPGLADATVFAFQDRSSTAVGLLRWLRSQEDASPLKHTLRLSELSNYEDAQRAGERLASDLGLGSVPADKLAECIEGALDIPVLNLDMIQAPGADSISGATIHLPNFTCILINRNESPGRRMFDLAHELFHALTWDVMPPAKLESNAIQSRGVAKKDRIEQFADAFAAAILMPRAQLEPALRRADTSSLEDLRALATHFHVSPVALAWRLFGLRLIGKNVCDQLKLMPASELGERPQPYSRRFAQSLGKALEAGQLSPRKAAKLLSIDLDALDALLRLHGAESPIEF